MYMPTRMEHVRTGADHKTVFVVQTSDRKKKNNKTEVLKFLTDFPTTTYVVVSD